MYIKVYQDLTNSFHQWTDLVGNDGITNYNIHIKPELGAYDTICKIVKPKLFSKPRLGGFKLASGRDTHSSGNLMKGVSSFR